MAKLTLEGREYIIAPFKIGSLRRAAPIIDRINATANSLTTLEGVFSSASDLIAVLAIGIEKLDPAMTGDVIEDMIGFGDMTMLRDAFQDVLREAGLISGEASAPLASEPEGALATASEASSTSSSPPA